MRALNKQLIQITLTTLLLLVNASLALANDGITVAQGMLTEASSMCTSGDCSGANTVLEIHGLSGTKELVQKVNLFYEDDRKRPSPTSTSRFLEPIGQLDGAQVRDPVSGQIGLIKMTATIVSPCLVVSMGPLHSPDDVEVVSIRETTTFRVGRGPGGTGFKYEVKAKLVASPKRDKSITSDWGLYYLSDCIGTDPEIGWMEFAPLDMKVDSRDSVAIAGIYSDKSLDALWLDPKCSLKERSTAGGVLYHDCASRAGTSGSPIFTIGEDGVPRIVAMHSGSMSDEKEIQDRYVSHKHPNSNANYAIDISHVYDQIKNKVAWDKMNWDGENPQIAMAREQGKPKVQKVKHTINWSARNSAF